MSRELPKIARYAFATRVAYERLVEERVDSFPIDVKAVCKANMIKLVTYQKKAEEFGESVADIAGALGGDRAKLHLFKCPFRYEIWYNDEEDDGVQQFALAHEFGHFCLHHLQDFDLPTATELTQDDDTWRERLLPLEKEANCFARNFLAPIYLVKPTRDFLQEFFGIGYYANEVRLQLQSNDAFYFRNALKSDDVLKESKGYFQKSRYEISNAWYCPNCRHLFVAKNARYCQYCGQPEPRYLDAQKILELKQLSKEEVAS